MLTIIYGVTPLHNMTINLWNVKQAHLKVHVQSLFKKKKSKSLVTEYIIVA